MLPNQVSRALPQPLGALCLGGGRSLLCLETEAGEQSVAQALFTGRSGRCGNSAQINSPPPHPVSGPGSKE